MKLIEVKDLDSLWSWIDDELDERNRWKDFAERLGFKGAKGHRAFAARVRRRSSDFNMVCRLIECLGSEMYIIVDEKAREPNTSQLIEESRDIASRWLQLTERDRKLVMVLVKRLNKRYYVPPEAFGKN